MIRKIKLKRKGSEKGPMIFLVLVIGLILMTFIGFGLVVMTIKVTRESESWRNSQQIPLKFGKIQKQTEDGSDGEGSSSGKKDVIVKEVFGEVVAIDDNVISVDSEVYGTQIKKIKFKIDTDTEAAVFKYETLGENNSKKVILKITDIEVGKYVNVSLPVEMLLSEVEKDVIFIDEIAVQENYSGENLE